MFSEIRKDYFLNKYVIITPSRAKRPKSFKTKASVINSNKKCPFCPKTIEKKLIVKIFPKIKKQQPWSVVVLNNKYPIVSTNNDNAYGKHEVVIETPEHNKEFSQLSIKEIENLLKVYQQRTEELSKLSKIDYILIFKNQGGKAGASVSHAHSQIFASELLPPDLEEEFLVTQKYQKKNKTCPYCDILKKEEKTQRRVYADENVVSFCPYASSYHYETWIFPRRHIDNITNLSEVEIVSFSTALKQILGKIYKLNISYNFFLHQVISQRNQHFYLKIQPREAVWGGIELGSGVIVNSLAPEKAAAYLRK